MTHSFFRWRYCLALGGFAACIATQALSAPPVYGLERMQRMALLPKLLEGTQVRQVSSRDRRGANDDGLDGTYSSLYIDGHGEHVMFDEIGAGCIYRIWITYGVAEPFQSQRIRFYFDDEASPRLDMSIADFFDGLGAPLEFPLVGNKFQSSGGYYCYLPFPFRERLKVTLSASPLYYNMTYHRYDANEGVASWTGTESTTNVLQQWNNAGVDPKPTDANHMLSTNVSLAASATGTLFRITGEGCIQSLTLDPSPHSTGILSGVRLQMNWDGGEPEVDVPLGDFFGSGAHEINVSALPIGMRTVGDYYCYFPMPYWQSADIGLVNDSDETLTALPCSVQFTTNGHDHAATGYFHADFKRNVFVDDSRDVIFLDVEGRGHAVGLSLHMQSYGAGGGGMSYLEGDERLHVDGSRSPALYGTGNEDYFNAGWYFNQGTFNLPYHGHPWRDQFHSDGTNYTQAYRFHLSDLIPFTSAIRFGMEHGWDDNNDPGTFSSVVYYYKQSGTAGGLVLTTDFHPGDAWSESLYGYSATESGSPVSNVWAYEGDDDGIRTSHTGMSYTGGVIEFTIPLVDNRGVLLRRHTDQGIGGQRARISVDGLPAGTWYESDHSFSTVNKRWLDAEFMIPATLVTGKVSTTIRIEPEGSPAAWNAYRYQAFCVKPLTAIADADRDELPDMWELTFAQDLTALGVTSNADADLDGLTDHQEYTAGTDPTNAASALRILPDTDFAFDSIRGRLYALEQCTDLVLTNWTTVRSDLPGTGGPLTIKVDAPSQIFRRIRVQKP